MATETMFTYEIPQLINISLLKYLRHVPAVNTASIINWGSTNKAVNVCTVST